MAVPEALLRSTKYGDVRDGDGWFVLNARDSRWRDSGYFGVYCDFEGKRPFRQLGVNISIFQPGQVMSLYHSENHQEGFLVLAGRCTLVVEGEERPLGAWDFFHCPGGTAHVIVGSGEGPAVVLAVGARGGRKGVVYPVDATARQHRASVDEEATTPAEAYSGFAASARCTYPEGALPDLA